MGPGLFAETSPPTQTPLPPPLPPCGGGRTLPRFATARALEASLAKHRVWLHVPELQAARLKSRKTARRALRMALALSFRLCHAGFQLAAVKPLTSLAHAELRFAAGAAAHRVL